MAMSSLSASASPLHRIVTAVVAQGSRVSPQRHLFLAVGVSRVSNGTSRYPIDMRDVVCLVSRARFGVAAQVSGTMASINRGVMGSRRDLKSRPSLPAECAYSVAKAPTRVAK